MNSWVGTRNKLPAIIQADRSESLTGVRYQPTLAEAPLSIEYSFQNGLPYPITVIGRDGLAFKITNTLSNWRSHYEFTVFIKYRFANTVKFDTQHVLNEYPDMPLIGNLKALSKAFSHSKVGYTLNGCEAVVAHHVSKKTFEENLGSVYLEDLDITLAADTPDVHTVHPDSELGFVLRKLQVNINGFNYKIVINDPNDDFGDRFVNMSNKVYRVKRTINLDKKPGVYLLVSSDDNTEVSEIFHEFDVADSELSLYRTSSDAKVYGNILEERKKEMEELQFEHRKELLKIEQESAKAKYELEQQLANLKEERAKHDLELASELNRLKQEESISKAALAKLEAELAEAKSLRDDLLNRKKLEYDIKSMDRKDSSEIIKWLPALLGGAFLVFSKVSN